MLQTVVLLGMTLAAAATDVLRKKIYNWNTYGGMLAGVALSAAHGAWLTAGGAADGRLWPWIFWPGSPSLYESLAGLLFCGGLLIVCYVCLPGVSGGDVKLMAMIGALLGWEKGLEALLWSFVLCACFTLILLVWRVGPVTTVSRVVRLMAKKMRLPWFMPLGSEEIAAFNVPMMFSPGALAAVVIVRFGLI